MCRQFGLRYLDCFPEMGPLRFDVGLGATPLFSATTPPAAVGRTWWLRSTVRRLLAQSGTVSDRAYLPLKITPQDFEFYSGWSDGAALYLSARPRSGPHAGRGGIYSVDALDGGVSAIAQHAARLDSMAPFYLHGADVYFVTHLTDDGTSVLMKTAKDGSGTPSRVALPDGGLNVLAVAADQTALFTVVEKADHSQVVVRSGKNEPEPAQFKESAGLGRCIPDTMALTRDFLVVMREGPPAALLRISKADLSVKELVEVGSTTGRRSVVCSETHCFWTEWTAGRLYRVPIEGGEKVDITSTNQPLLIDGAQLYSGINGIIRVGPNQAPPAQKLVALGGGIPLLALDANYVYFGHDGRVWRLHK